MNITPSNALAAVSEHGTIFFNANLQPVTPVAGQWFCEFHIIPSYEAADVIVGEALVEYLGPDDSVVWNKLTQAFETSGDALHRHRVAAEHDDADRRPRGEILILQS